MRIGMTMELQPVTLVPLHRKRAEPIWYCVSRPLMKAFVVWFISFHVSLWLSMVASIAAPRFSMDARMAV